MDADELRTGLRQAGLSEYQADAYVALLDLGSAAVTEIADRAGVPKSRIYDVLRDLEEEGYIETFEQDALRARACDPDAVVGAFRERADRLRDVAEEVSDRWQQAGVGGHRLSIVKRMETVMEQARETIRRADTQLQVSLTPAQFERLRADLRAACEDDVFVMASIHTSPHRPDALPDEATLSGTVVQARHRRLPAPFLVVSDRCRACFAPHDRSTDQYGVIVEDQTLSYVFYWYFQTALWVAWEPIHEGRGDSLPTTYVDIRECIRDVEPLLDDGLTVTVSIEGSDVETGEERRLHGEITEVLYTRAPEIDGSAMPLSNLAGQATIVVRSDGTEYGVGGPGAVLEDVEAARVTIESVSES